MCMWIWLFLSATAVRLRRTPVALLEASREAPDGPECPPVRVDPKTSSVSIPAPTFTTQLYESVGHCNDSSVAAGETKTFQAIVRDGDEWRGTLPLPDSERTSHLCAVGIGCVGNYDGVPAEPPEDAFKGVVGAGWVPLEAAWPLRVLHNTMLVFAIVSLVVTVFFAVVAPQAFHWFPPDRVGHEPPVELPPDYELMGEVALSLLKMFVATATLWLILFVFVVRRSVSPWSAGVILVLPLLLMFTHTSVVMWNMFRKSLYYSLFAQGIHINFPDRKLMFDHWLAFLVAAVLFLYCAGACLWEETEATGSRTSRVLMVLIKMSAVLTPLAYSLMLLWSDDQFVWTLRPLHQLFARHEGMQFGQEKLDSADLADTTKFIHELTPIDEDQFLAAGHKLVKGADGAISDVTLVEPSMIMEMKGKEDLPRLGHWDTWQTLKWTIPISFSRNILRFRIAIGLVMFAGAAVCMILGFMLSYYMHLYPTLASVDVMHGMLQPPFDPHVFHYTIMVDKHVKGEQLDIIPNQEVTTHFRIYDNRGMDSVVQASENGGVGSVYVPYFRHPEKKEEDEVDGADFIAAQEHPATFYVDVVGAGTTMTYVFTAVKTQTVLTDLTYTYLASGENVTVARTLQTADLLASAEDTDAAPAVIGEDDTIEVYIPPTTEEVEITVDKELVIYGPKPGRRVDPKEFGWLEAGASVHLCPPTQDHCTADRSDRMKLDALERGVVAVPVVLAAKGGETKSFTVALVRVHNRLTNMQAATFAPGRDWRGAVLNPPFDPMHLYYQAFFEAAPEKAGDLFVKLMPAGDPGVNHLLLDFEAPPGVTLVPFCRHPEEYMIAESDAELDCSTDPKALRMRTLAGEEFRGHLLVRVETKRHVVPDPFEVKITVVAEETGTQQENRTYTFRFLPQRPMHMSVRLPSGAPAVLEPAFSSEVLNYTAIVPAAAPEVTVELTPTSSFWASTDPEELRSGDAASAGLVQTVTLSAPPCSGGLERPTSYPGQLPGDDVDRNRAAAAAAEDEALVEGNATAPEVLQERAAAYCPVEVMAFERRQDFPRVFHVQMLPAAPGTVVFLGAAGSDGKLAALPAFSPLRRSFQTVLPIEGASPSLVVSPAAGITASWNGAPLAVAVNGTLASIDLAPVRAEICACQRLTGCGEEIPGVDVGKDDANGCELVVSAGKEPYTVIVREGATALRLEESSLG